MFIFENSKTNREREGYIYVLFQSYLSDENFILSVSQWKVRTEGANGRYKKSDGMKLCYVNVKIYVTDSKQSLEFYYSGFFFQ